MPSQSTNTSTASKVLKSASFTSSSSWSVPLGITEVLVDGGGGGGGGGCSNSGTTRGGGGGAGGERNLRALPTTPGSTLTITIGSGGAAGAAAANGGNGGNTSISGPGGSLTWAGGLGGYASTLSAADPYPPSTGAFPGAATRFDPAASSNTARQGGAGGSGITGVGGAGGSYTGANGSTPSALNRSAGGGGAGANQLNFFTGGTGIGGYVTIYWVGDP